MSAPIQNKKNGKQMAVSLAVLEIIEKDGLLGVTHSKVSRKTGVSRAWIYEYIGKDKNAFIGFAADAVASHLARVKMDLPSSKEQLQNQLKDGVHFLFTSVIQDPVIIKIYFRFRGTQNPIGEVIAKYERYWLNVATESTAKILDLPADQATLFAELVLTLRLGFAHRIASSEKPNEARDQAEKTFDLIHGLITGLV